MSSTNNPTRKPHIYDPQVSSKPNLPYAPSSLQDTPPALESPSSTPVLVPSSPNASPAPLPHVDSTAFENGLITLRGDLSQSSLNVAGTVDGGPGNGAKTGAEGQRGGEWPMDVLDRLPRRPSSHPMTCQHADDYATDHSHHLQASHLQTSCQTPHPAQPQTSATGAPSPNPHKTHQQPVTPAVDPAVTIHYPNYTFLKTAGVGAFSVVKLATKKDAPAETVAVKVIPKRLLEKDERFRSISEREIELLQMLDHKNIVKFVDMGETEEYKLIMMEYEPGGELFTFVAERFELMTVEIARCIFTELVDVVQYLHAHHVAHRDLKLENILLTSKTPPFTLKLTDFGLAQRLDIQDQSETQHAALRVGSDEYAAPELVTGQAYDARVTDVWAMGVVLYALLAGFLPFVVVEEDGEDTHRQHQRKQKQRQKGNGAISEHVVLRRRSTRRGRKGLLHRIARAEFYFPDDSPESDVEDDGGGERDLDKTGGDAGAGSSPSSLFDHDSKDLIRRILTPSPRKRITLEAIRLHPWMQGKR